MFYQEYHTLCLGDEMPEISFHPEASSLHSDEFGCSDGLFKIWPLDDTTEAFDSEQSLSSLARDTAEPQPTTKDKINERLELGEKEGLSESYAKEKSNIEGSTEFACPTCKKTFTSFTKLFNHMQVHGRRLQCYICDKVFANRSHLCLHIQRHMKIRPHHCQECSFSSTDKHDLIVHITRHMNERKFECMHCNKKFFRRVELNYHRKYVHQHTNIKQCKLCIFLTHSRSILNHHNISKHQTKKTFHCHKCKAVFQHKYSLIIHMRIHTGLKPFSCIRCKKLFKSKSELTSHFNSHKVPSYSCAVCNKKFSRRSNLFQHKVIHAKKKTHLCTLCSYSSFWRSTLVRHIKTVHKTASIVTDGLSHGINRTRMGHGKSCSLTEMSVPEKKIKQPTCGRAMELQISNDSISYSYKKCDTHSKLHRKIHICPECFKVFKRKSELNSHLFVHKENSFQCDVCNKKFKTKSNLNRHFANHNSLKPYSCRFCSYTSNLKTSLTRHASSKHGSRNLV